MRINILIIKMLHRRKPCDVQMRKNQYIAHIRKMEQLKSSNSPFHRSLVKERRDIDSLIEQTRKLHKESIQSEMKKRQIRQILTQRQNFKHVPSALKQQISRKILSIPEKHKPDNFFVDLANLKLVGKILNAKSQFNFKKLSLDHLNITSRIKEKTETLEDFSKIYRNSKICTMQMKRIVVRLSKASDNVKIHLRFLNSENLQFFKNTNQFTILVKNDEKCKKSKLLFLSQILRSQLVIQLPPVSTSIEFYERLGERDIKRFKLNLTESQLNGQDLIERMWTQKIIQDAKNKPIGTIEIQIKKKRMKRMIRESKTYFQKTSELFQAGKENAE